MLGNIQFTLPPRPEQQQIVTYLDQKTSHIDELIDKKTRKIELLKEYRTSLINQVITKGLDPDVEMKDSGVEWIGEIPNHWWVIPLKRVSEVTLGKMRNRTGGPNMVEKPYLKSRNVQPEKIVLDTVENMWFTTSELMTNRLRWGDLVVSEGGDVGKTGMWKDELSECFLEKSILRVRFGSGGDCYYGSYVFQILHKTDYFSSIVDQVSIPHLTKERLSPVVIPLPSLPEQQQIVTYLDQKTQEIDTSIQTEEKKIEHLKEYRQSLISNVVTGKIDVRETFSPN